LRKPAENVLQHGLGGHSCQDRILARQPFRPQAMASKVILFSGDKRYESAMNHQHNGLLNNGGFLGILPLSFLHTTFSGATFAQDFEFHPMLSDNFNAVLGAFSSDNSFNISAQGDIQDEIERTIDFDDSLGVDESSTLLMAQLR